MKEHLTLAQSVYNKKNKTKVKLRKEIQKLQANN
jgi:hypothetical protein